MINIPVGVAPLQVFSLFLESERIEFRLRHLSLADRWEMSLTRDGVVILAGQRLTLGTNFFEPHNFKLGGLICFANDEPGRDPGRYDLGTRVQLVHVSEAEIEAVQS